VEFLVDVVGLSPQRLSFTYFGGGTLREASNDLIKVDREFLEDAVTRDTLRELGFAESQLIPETSLDTFLAVFPPPVEFWAGYRIELFYTDPVDGYRFEIGTAEHLHYRQVKNGSNTTVDVVPQDGCFVGCAVGMDRLLMAVNNYHWPYQCDHIAPVYEAAFDATYVDDDHAVAVLTDAVRALHRIVADGFGFDNLPSPEIKGRYNTYWAKAMRAIEILEMDPEVLSDLCAANVTAQPWYPELAAAKERVIAEREAYLKRRRLGGDPV